jgi:Uma2 family endonuclease
VNIHAPMQRMTVEQCLEWADARGRTVKVRERWELIGGEPKLMQDPERYVHVRNKSRVERAVEAAIIRAGLAYEVTADGLGVRINGSEYFIPEVVVFPKGRIGANDRFAPDPIIVVEVLSPSTTRLDLTTKVAGYGSLPTIWHYLVVDPDASELLHYRRTGDVLVAPHGPTTGDLLLEPPGIVLSIAELFRT